MCSAFHSLYGRSLIARSHFNLKTYIINNTPFPAADARQRKTSDLCTNFPFYRNASRPNCNKRLENEKITNERENVCFAKMHFFSQLVLVKQEKICFNLNSEYFSLKSLLDPIFRLSKNNDVHLKNDSKSKNSSLIPIITKHCTNVDEICKYSNHIEHIFHIYLNQIS